MAGAKKGTTRRRKIFPHLEDGAKKDGAGAGGAEPPSPSSAPKATGAGGGGGAGATPPNGEDYDNAKSDKSKGKGGKGGKGSKGGGSRHPSARKPKPDASSDSVDAGADDDASAGHLLPLPLVLTALVCSGLLWVASFRDAMSTGKPILDTLGFLWGSDDADANYLEYTKSTAWFDDSRGWKSKQGGLSTVLAVTTDANNMGGLFVRKMAGAAGMAFHLTKLWPIVFHVPPSCEIPGAKGSGGGGAKSGGRPRWVGASWAAGHFDPLLTLAAIGDACVALFFLARMEELKSAGAGGLCAAFVTASVVEAFVFGLYLLGRRMGRERTEKSSAARTSVPAGGIPLSEDPNSLPSRIAARTVLIVSSLIALISLRDVLLPGTILSFVPRDDIYLEWTGAFLHSPPPDTVEADEHGLEAPLHAGDKLVSQLMGLYLSLGCLFKFASVAGWSKGSRGMGGGSRWENADRGGVVSSRMIWRAQAFGDAMILGMLRMFTPASMSASLDLRWHLMLVAYEALILFLYGFW
ncbi:hypothetical protein ACHAWF_006722 [Thalassiosira exigua]